ncbi:MAG: DUF6504 family protein [Armatimonadota bacterium]|nr:DUF6504 family protein [Armatimonadota bacterium]
MTKSIGEPIEIATIGGDRCPDAFTWRGRRYRVVETGGTWRLLGRWWEGDGERCFLRVMTEAGKCFDLCRYAATDQWHVYRVWD